MAESLESKFSKTDKAIIHDMHQMLQNQGKIMDRVTVTIYGDKDAGIDGLVKTTQNNSEVVKEYQKDKTKVLVFLGIFSTLASAAWAWAIKKFL